jgi:hypothetical protein
MKRSLSIATLAIAVAAFLGTPAMPVQASSNPITIQQCFVTQPKALSKNASGTQIDYTNTSSRTATQIIFAVGYRNAQSHFLRQVTDTGTFTPGTAIQHHYDLYNDITYAGKEVHGCSAVSVKFANGTSWHQ